jgi:RNA recognition motif-containing protein
MRTHCPHFDNFTFITLTTAAEADRAVKELHNKRFLNQRVIVSLQRSNGISANQAWSEITLENHQHGSQQRIFGQESCYGLWQRDRWNSSPCLQSAATTHTCPRTAHASTTHTCPCTARASTIRSSWTWSPLQSVLESQCDLQPAPSESAHPSTASCQLQTLQSNGASQPCSREPQTRLSSPACSHPWGFVSSSPAASTGFFRPTSTS